MQGNETVQTPIIEGCFRPTQVRSARRYSRPLLLLVIILGAGALVWRSPTMLAAATAVGALWILALSRKSIVKRVKVRLDGSVLTVDGDGYETRIEAPFRFKTGVQRIPATGKDDETCFVRMVIDVQGKPLVLEEQVHAGYFPPQLDDIVGISGALGIAQLTSLTPYPGTLWSLIEGLEALTQASPAAELEDSVESLYRIGRQQLADKDYREASETFSTLLRQRPDSAPAYYSRGAARYHAKTELDKAVNDLTTALRLEPNQHEAYRMRGLARAQQGDWAGLRDDCSLALQFHPTNAELYSLRGTACYRLQDFDGALANFNDAVRLDASRHGSFYNRGLARHRQGNLTGAIEDFQQALRLSPEFTEAQRNMQTVRQQLARSQPKPGS